MSHMIRYYTYHWRYVNLADEHKALLYLPTLKQLSVKTSHIQ